MNIKQNLERIEQGIGRVREFHQQEVTSRPHTKTQSQKSDPDDATRNDTGSATPQVTLGTGKSLGEEEVPSFESVEISIGDGELTNTVNHWRGQWPLCDEPGNR